MVVHGHEVRGVDVDPGTRCAHYRGPLDVVAIKFRCCLVYYPCHRCHEQVADHPARLWARGEFGEKAALCGACGIEMAVSEYLACGSRCPGCGQAFNPACEGHHRLYFEP